MVGIRLFYKREPSVLFYNASGFIISAIREKIRCGLRSFDVFLCGLAGFGPPYAPLNTVSQKEVHTSRLQYHPV